MANEMPNPAEFGGLSRKVLEYSDAFRRVVERAKRPGFTDAEWAPLEDLVATDEFEREGVFFGETSEIINWPDYRKYASQFAGSSTWEGTMRGITEVPGRVFLELEERITSERGKTVCNSVTVYNFNKAGKICHLDVYVQPKT